jgi:formylglycine-generating enzyme required for sulfatase activity
MPSEKRKKRTLTLGSGLLLGLAIVIVIAMRPTGRHSEPSKLAPTTENSPCEDPEDARQETGPAASEVSVYHPGEIRNIEIAPGVKMVFCWIPAGDCQLGSTKYEQDYIIKTFHQPEARGVRLTRETELTRGTFKTAGFWMGIYEVTQAEWKAVMGDNPSLFDGTSNNNARGLDTSRFPVESVSWDRICGTGKYVGKGFLDKINGHSGIQNAFGKPGKFRLPKEDEWEYACRGGRGNKRPFFWGCKLNGSEANCYGYEPYGTSVRGQYLGRTCAVDDTNDGKYERHPWGLMHMCGNVYEYCEDFYDRNNQLRVARGGSWSSSATSCRAAARFSFVSDHESDRGDAFGFRLLVNDP